MRRFVKQLPPAVKTAVTYTAVLLLGAIACVKFPTPFENIVVGQKIRPFAVVCDPPDGAPGDTVSVRLHYYTPPGKKPAIRWSAALDYGVDSYGNKFEKRMVDLGPMMLAASLPDSFRFRIPDSM